ncbi:MAG: DUF1428 domain-containing protein [Armatimonadota bacterium]|nr:DUF1428 domain-containing protein [Armatimonadota bacterium]MDQ3199544.1 DUF1428 domain-containing protein [Verrucomicrobiota bacterium]
MKYIDGYVLPVPRKNLKAYFRIATKAAKIWREHGALEVRECAGEQLEHPYGTSFPDLVKPKRGETVVFSWVVFRSRAHRDAVNKKVMNDPRLAEMMKMKSLPFDPKRMAYGGFITMVDQ